MHHMHTRSGRVKTTMLLLLTFFALFNFLGCSGDGGGGGGTDSPDVDTVEAQAEAAEVTLSLTLTDSEYERLLLETDAAGARSALVTWLQDRPEVATAGESSDGYTIWIEYTNGVEASFFTDRSSGEISVLSLSSSDSERPQFSIAALPPITLLGQSNYIIVFLPFFFEMTDFCSEAGWGSNTACTDWLNFPRPDQDIYLANFMAQYYHHPDLMTGQPLNATMLLNENASVMALAGFLAVRAFDPQHLYINTHGGVIEDGDGNDVMNMSVGDRVDPGADHFRDLWRWLKAGELRISQMHGEPYWAVKPAFIRRWLGQRPAGSAPLHVHNASCYGYHDSMRQAFMENGAASYSGYDGRAINGFIMESTQLYIKQLTTGITVTEAHSRVVPGEDYTYGTGTHFLVSIRSADERWFHQVSAYLDGQVDDRLVTPTNESFVAVDDPQGGIRLFSSLVHKPATTGGLPVGGIVGELNMVIPTAATGTFDIESSDITAIYITDRSSSLTYGATQELKEESPTCRGIIRIEKFDDTAGGIVEGSFEGTLVNETNVFETRTIGGSFSALRSK